MPPPPVRSNVGAFAHRAFRPALEALEAREVPARFDWLGTVSTDALNAANWLSSEGPSALPGEDDHLHFGGMSIGTGEEGGPPSPGGGTSVNCDNLQSLGDGFAGVYIGSSYTATVTMGEALTFGVFDLANGAISQSASAYDLTVTDTFTWTGGTLNSSTTAATFTLSGATATINPGAENTVSTSDTLIFENAATGTFLPGTLYFTGGTGLVVNEFSWVNVLLPDATAKFTEKNAGTDEKKNWIKAGGGITITGPGTWESKLPVVNEGGKFTVQGKATASLSGKITINEIRYSGYSQFGNTSVLLLENGSTLEVPQFDSITLKGGKLATTRAATGLQSALIRGQLWVGNADIELDDPGYAPAGSAHVFSTLSVSGQLNWYGGVFRPSVGWSATDATGQKMSDKIEVSGESGKVNIDVDPLPAGGTTGAKIGPRPIVNAGNRNLTNVTWDVIVGVMEPIARSGATSVPFEVAAQGDDWSNGLSEDKGALVLKHK